MAKIQAGKIEDAGKLLKKKKPTAEQVMAVHDAMLAGKTVATALREQNLAFDSREVRKALVQQYGKTIISQIIQEHVRPTMVTKTQIERMEIQLNFLISQASAKDLAALKAMLSHLIEVIDGTLAEQV